MKQQGNKDKSSQTAPSRFREILSVLRKYRLLKGITPQKLREMLEELGPTFVKIGQILSMRQDMLPKAYCDELSKLRSQVKPLSFSVICTALEEEYGCPWREKFEKIEETPLGAASIAQVHAARLPGGQRVIVKVQRPRIYETMREDIAILKRAAKLLKLVGRMGDVIDFKAVLEEIWAVAQQEMDFLLEADHMKEFARNNSGVRYIALPRVIDSLTTGKVLVMDYVDGVPVDQVAALERLGYNLSEIGEKLAENYVKQVLDDAFFHADPHPGNIWVSGGKIVWLDFGMMGRLTERDKRLFRAAVDAIVNDDVYELKNAFLSIGIVRGKIDHAALYTDIDSMLTRYGSMELGDMNLAQAFGEFMEIANRHRISMPQGVTMLARGMMTIEGALSLCAPEINLMEILANHLSSATMREVDFEQALKKAGKTLYGALNRSAAIPAQVSSVLKMAAKGQARLNVELTGSEAPLKRFEGAADRLAAAVIIAALVVGASLLCTAGGMPRVWGMPVPALILYTVAFILLVCLLIGVLRRRRRK